MIFPQLVSRYAHTYLGVWATPSYHPTRANFRDPMCLLLVCMADFGGRFLVDFW
nr:MAG TPA: jmjN domain [Caudoviricetes sp.]